MDAWATAHWPRLVEQLAADSSPPRAAHPQGGAPGLGGPTGLGKRLCSIRSRLLSALSSSGLTPLLQSAVATRTYHSEPLLLGWPLRRPGGARSRAMAGSTWACDVGLLATVAGTLASAVSSGLLIQTASFEVGRGKRWRGCRADGELHRARRLRSRPAAWPLVANVERQSGTLEDEPDSHGRLLTIRRPPTRRAPHVQALASRSRRPSGRRASAAIRERAERRPPPSGRRQRRRGRRSRRRRRAHGVADRVGGGADGVAQQHGGCRRLTAVPGPPEPSQQAGKRARARAVTEEW